MDTFVVAAYGIAALAVVGYATGLLLRQRQVERQLEELDVTSSETADDALAVDHEDRETTQ